MIESRIKQLEKQIERKLEQGRPEPIIIYESRSEIPELPDREAIKIFLPDNNRDRKLK